jgi:hypothetical protein
MQKPADIVGREPLVLGEGWDLVPVGIALPCHAGPREADAARLPGAPASIDQLAALPVPQDGMIIIHATPHRRGS